jgi:hypothetical protein
LKAGTRVETQQHDARTRLQNALSHAGPGSSEIGTSALGSVRENMLFRAAVST